MTASDSLFDSSKAGFSGLSYPMKTLWRIKV